MRWREAVDPALLPLIPTNWPTLGDLRVDELPALYDERRATADVEPSANVERRDVDLDGVPLRVHRPRDAQVAVPSIYFIHGGSFVLGSHRMDDRLLDRWSSALGCACIAVDYRLAPEVPYPGPLDDCVRGFVALREHAGELGIDRRIVGIAGVSAGGALAVGTALRLRDEGATGPSFLLLDSPSLDDRQVTASSAWDVPIAGPATSGWAGARTSVLRTDATTSRPTLRRRVQRTCVACRRRSSRSGPSMGCTTRPWSSRVDSLPRASPSTCASTRAASMASPRSPRTPSSRSACAATRRSGCDAGSSRATPPAEPARALGHGARRA